VVGVATYAHELFQSAGELDAVYVPIGLGSGICGVISIRDLLGLKTKVIGVVAERANAYRLSFDARHVVATNSALSFADGMAVRVPHPDALAVINRGAERIIEVGEDEIADAMRLYYRTTHNVAEGAGAAALAALMKERAQMIGKRVGVILSGGNIDAAKFAQVLQGRTPLP
jgi:threonine dehydratase